MSDYRNNLFKHYVSTFKYAECSTPVVPSSAWRYFEQKYYGHIRHLSSDAPILEVGCGPGVLLACLKQKGFLCIQGIDISQEQIELAKLRDLPVNCADVFEFLANKVEAFDAVIAVDFIEHFTKEEALSLLALLYRALRKDGVLLVQTPNGQGLFASQIIYGDLTHCTIFTPGSLSQALRLVGFGQIVFGETGPIPKNLQGVFRVVIWKLIKGVLNFARMVEAGKRQQVWTENLICASRKIDTPKLGHE